MSLRTATNDTPIQDIAKIIHEDGGIIIKGFLSKEFNTEFRNHLNDMLNEIPNGSDAYFAGTKTKRMSNLFMRTDLMQNIALHPVYLGVAKEILQKPITMWSGEKRVENIPDIQIGVTQAIKILPGQPAQPMHRDDAVWLWRHPNYGREARVQIMVAVTEFTKENGATLVIPGSHLWDDEKKPELSAAISAEMEEGDALIWIGSLYHAGGANLSQNERLGVTMSYDLAILRQEENFYLSIPIERMKQFPKELQDLLGWKMSSTYAGFIEINGEMQAPSVLLES
ncbi:phytanoyl-CoA dioxygenase family protein [Acinetobacter baumannii]|uniref:phytanoyl-CoA dioxygenase family protein n=1 Tax=Acinetobacter baumannii TaxID=470 RepID=UPI00244A182A|nr:phytanoyl-CoA dioxygenase family protein [Acinetobacter baumannii]MDH2528292.1 phytanoyl-CoA dioxygenase family protein [Acinetobacter baumannii]